MGPRRNARKFYARKTKAFRAFEGSGKGPESQGAKRQSTAKGFGIPTGPGSFRLRHPTASAPCSAPLAAR
eukprot:5390411-Pyramimonas_sp.AAC.1